ncbi:glycosyltransferase family A protein [Acinetobacter sp. SA01]|uniref:glycosyltransferase family 2 protein n=1 Tax=Acinetobacter sp. SA01 TaxID=1862567 RepID=UPI0014078280|nr:glycosyltransferase family A protein [Acinetobacter sp. SA01]
MLLTIFTPTYNRGNTLGRLYENLKEQNFKNFEWLIIDDGSTDNTEEVVNSFLKENKITIKYIKQINKGKQACWNLAIDLASGDLFCGVDSDDVLNGNILDIIIKKYLSTFLENPVLIGIRCNSINSKTLLNDGGKVVNIPKVLSYNDEISKKKYIGERIDIFKTKLLKDFKYPVDKDIKFIPELWFYIKVTKENYKFLYVPETLGFFFNDVEINRLGKSSIKNNSVGHYISRSCILKNTPIRVFLNNPKFYIYSLIRFIQCANYSKISFKRRCADTNVFYTLLSYMLFFLMLGLK